jgi:hypothetical protein
MVTYVVMKSFGIEEDVVVLRMSVVTLGMPRKPYKGSILLQDLFAGALTLY